MDGLLLFPWVMLALLALGMGVATLADSSIWVPKRLGIGYTLDLSKPLAWVMLAYMLSIVLLILFGATHPHAPGISNFIQFLGSLRGAP